MKEMNYQRRIKLRILRWEGIFANCLVQNSVQTYKSGWSKRNDFTTLLVKLCF